MDAQMRFSFFSKQRGFTVTELLVSWLIMAVLLGVAYPSWDMYVRRTRMYEVQQAMMDNIRHLERYYSHHYSFKKNSRAWATLPHKRTQHFCIRMQGQPKGIDAGKFTMKAVSFDKEREPRVLVVNQDSMWTICATSGSSCADTGYFKNPGRVDHACAVQ